jgi:photosystem II stability/assembly factor-like uncharacterized protein
MIGNAPSPFLSVRPDGSWSLGKVAAPVSLPSFLPAAISCPTPQHCVAAGALAPAQGPGSFAAVAISDDGGSNWTAQVVDNADGDALNAIACPTAQDCFAAGSLLGGGDATVVLVSTDGGQHWSARSVSGPIGEVVSLACWDSADCLAAGAIVRSGQPTGNALAETRDGGAQWSSQTFPVTGSLACPASKRCVLTGVVGQSFRLAALYSTDGGATWPRAGLGGLPVVSFANLACASARLCVAVGQGRGFVGTADHLIQAGVILESATTGSRWTSRRLPKGVGSLQTVACALSGFCVAGASHLSGPHDDGWRLLLRHPSN